MKKKNSNHNNEMTVTTFLNRHQIDYLDKIGKDCFFKFGHKVSRAKILSRLVDLLMHLDISFEKLDLEHETLLEGLERLIKNAQKAEV